MRRFALHCCLLAAAILVAGCDGLPGGGGITELPYKPGPASAAPQIGIELNVWGAGGDVDGRFKGVQMIYTIAGQQPEQRISGEIVKVSKERVRYNFSVKRYAGADEGRLAYRFEKVFDGYPSSTPGMQDITISRP